MVRYSRPGVSAERWWKDLAPFFSDGAAADYIGTDPTEVRSRKVTGAVRLVPATTIRLVIAHVPTDAGLYAVTMSRSTEAPRWVVERITPPEPDPH